MPYVSDKQRRFFHTKKALKKGITPEMVHEFDQASKGKSMVKASKEKVHKERMRKRMRGEKI